MDEITAKLAANEFQWSDDDDTLCVQCLEESDVTAAINSDDIKANTHNITKETKDDDAINDLEDTEDEDNIPLASLISKTYDGPNTMDKRMSEASDTDSSVIESSGNDSTFKISSSCSDSESSDTYATVRKSRKRKRTTSRRCRKRNKESPTPVRYQQHGDGDARPSIRCTDQGNIASDLERAKVESIKNQNLREIAIRFHRKRLNLLLNSNGLQSMPVPSDGNCFFAAVVASLKEDTEPQTLRILTCEHILTHQVQSPKKKCSSRKKRNPAVWKCNVRKEQRLRGESYLSCRGKIILEKSVQFSNCDKCRFKCSERINSQHQQHIFESYYGLSSYEAQRGFLCQMVSTGAPVRSKGKRTSSRQYHLVCNEEKIHVCRAFFLATLNIGRKVVEQALKAKEHGMYTGCDKRGSNKSANKTDEGTLNLIRDHINSFPRMESHYARKDSNKSYLPHDLNIRKMYKLYKDQCVKKGIRFVKEGKYREVFCGEFNISFFKPKKDQCSLCNLYEAKKIAGTLTDKLNAKYQEHQESKTNSRNEKEKDKSKAQKDNTNYLATFDLQAVLTTPCTLVGELYYARKLSVYNLSIYSLGDQQGTCHLWDECNGKRGPNEIATCLLKNTTSICNLGRHVKVITYYSDTCGGQNRNQFVAGSLLYGIKQNPTLDEINHKFLTSGHSQMECDSIHSAIETAKKRTQVFAPVQWSTVICLARGGKQYVTVPMKFGDVLNFKDYSKKAFTNMKVSTDGERINWLKLKWVQVRREAKKSIFVNYGFNPAEFKEIKVTTGTRRKSQVSIDGALPQPAYAAKLPISMAKKADLLKLCEKEILPEHFHAYYHSLPTSNECADRLPAPGSDDESADEQ